MSETKQRLAVPFELKGVNSKERSFEAYLSTFDVDLGGDRVRPGAFTNTLAEWRASRRTIPLLDQHTYGSIRSVLGKMLDGVEDGRGLWTKWKVVSGQDGDEALHRVEGGFVSEMSMGYEPIRWDFEEVDTGSERKRIRNLHEVHLGEGSLVIWAMQPNARIALATVKSAVCHLDPTDRRRLASFIGNSLRPTPDSPDGEAASPEKIAELDERLSAAITKSKRIRFAEDDELAETIRTALERARVTDLVNRFRGRP